MTADRTRQQLHASQCIAVVPASMSRAFLSLGKLVDSRYAAAAKEEEKISSAVTFSPSDLNLEVYPARLFVLLFVTNTSRLPCAARQGG